MKMAFSLLPLVARIMCSMLKGVIVSMACEKWTSADRPVLSCYMRIISVCIITPLWTVMLSQLSLCNGPAWYSQVHCISNAQVNRGWHRHQWKIEIGWMETGSRGKKNGSRVKCILCTVSTPMFIIEQSSGQWSGLEEMDTKTLQN